MSVNNAYYMLYIYSLSGYTDPRHDSDHQEDTDDTGSLEPRSRAGVDGNRPPQPYVRRPLRNLPFLDAGRGYSRNARPRVRHPGGTAGDEARGHHRDVRAQRAHAHR